MLTVNQNGIYCEPGNFYLDPWRPVDNAIISHAHADHARWGSKAYLAATPGINLLKERVGKEAPVEGVPYGKHVTINDVSVFCQLAISWAHPRWFWNLRVSAGFLR